MALGFVIREKGGTDMLIGASFQRAGKKISASGEIPCKVQGFPNPQRTLSVRSESNESFKDVKVERWRSLREEATRQNIPFPALLYSCWLVGPEEDEWTIFDWLLNKTAPRLTLDTKTLKQWDDLMTARFAPQEPPELSPYGQPQWDAAVNLTTGESSIVEPALRQPGIPKKVFNPASPKPPELKFIEVPKELVTNYCLNAWQLKFGLLANQVREGADGAVFLREDCHARLLFFAKTYKPPLPKGNVLRLHRKMRGPND